MQQQDQGIFFALWTIIKNFFRSAVREGMEEGFRDFQESIQHDDGPPAIAPPPPSLPSRAVPFQNNGQAPNSQQPQINGQPQGNGQPGDEPRRRGRRPNNPQAPLFPPIPNQPGQPQQQQ